MPAISAALVVAVCLLASGCSGSQAEAPQPIYVVVDASISAGRAVELFFDDFKDSPYRQDIVPGVRRRYVFGPFERPPLRLRLDPSEEAGATVVLYGMTVRSAGGHLARISAHDLDSWFCDGVTDVRRSIETLTLHSSTNDPVCISPVLTLTAGATAPPGFGMVGKILGAGFILVLVALVVAGLLRVRGDSTLSNLGLAGTDPSWLTSSPAPERLIRRYLWFLTVCYVVTAITAIATDRHLYADGSAYLLYDILLGGHFVFPQRSFSYVYYQGPTLLAIEAGIRSVRVLSWLYGCVLFSPPILGAWLSWWVCRRSDVKLVFFPVFCCLSVLLSWMFYPVTEVHLTVSSFWPLFCFALAWGPAQSLRFPQVLVGGALVLFFGLSHDSALFLAPLLAGPALWRARAMQPGRVRAGVIAVGLAGVAAAVGHMVLNVSNMAVSGSTFFTGLLDLEANRLLIVNLLALACAVFCFVPWIRDRGTVFMNAALLGAGLYVLCEILTQSLELRPWSHQSTRGAAPMVAMLIAGIAAWVFKSRFWEVANWVQMWRLATLAFAVGVAWHAFATSQWVGYRRIFTNELKGSYGLVEFETTDLAREQFGQQTLRAMTFLWELPHQSILWSDGEVTSILHSSHMAPLSKMVGRREFPELEAFNRFVEPRIVP